MKMRREIAGFRKGKEFHYSTSVAATKGEKLAVWGCALLFICGVLTAIFVLKSIPAMILSIFGGGILMLGVMFFCAFRSGHREERIQNTFILKEDVNEKWCNLPDRE